MDYDLVELLWLWEDEGLGRTTMDSGSAFWEALGRVTIAIVYLGSSSRGRGNMFLVAAQQVQYGLVEWSGAGACCINYLEGILKRNQRKIRELCGSGEGTIPSLPTLEIVVPRGTLRAPPTQWQRQATCSSPQPQ